MVQSILLFLLGFLSAALLALIVAPAVWNRAVRLTRKRITASLPLSRNEIEAEKDGLRAGFALDIRQLEMKLDAARDRIARQMVEVGNLQETLRKDREAQGVADRDAAARDGELAQLRNEIGRLTAVLGIANETIDRIEADRARQVTELVELSAQHEEAALKAGSLEVELARRESEIAQFAEKARAERESRKQNEGRSRSAVAELGAAEAALTLEKRRAADLEARLERAVAQHSDLTERLDRRERELESMRASLRQPAENDDGKVLSLETARLVSDNAALREKVLDIAAMVVALTAQEEGPASPINAALAADGADGRRSGLAERVRAMQASASGGRG